MTAFASAGRDQTPVLPDTTLPIRYKQVMSTVEEIEQAIAKLAPRDLDRLRAWFEEFQAARFDETIERDAEAGKLDRAADEALAAHRRGRSREL
ncbi:MAG TPA: hypothetical protein VIH40_10600 [Xanthobacteraceae bacterium]